MDHRESPHYGKATEAERLWFDTFFASRNELKATYAAYKVNSDDSARAIARKVSARPHIVALIEQFVPDTKPPVKLPTKEELMCEYITIARDNSSTPRDKLSALNSYERLCGWSKAKPRETDAGFDPALDDIRE